MSQFETIAIVRVHDQDYQPDVIYGAMAEHVDAMFFLAHKVSNPSILEAAARQPKCREIREHRPAKGWNWTRSMWAMLNWAEALKPRFLLYFDEDELPPARLDEVLQRWKSGAAPTLWFQFVWTYGDLDHIISVRSKQFGYHVKAIHWRPGLAAAASYAWNCPPPLQRSARVVCPYPVRHTSATTPEQRALRGRPGRREAKNRTWERDWPTIPYDPNMTWNDWARGSRSRRP